MCVGRAGKLDGQGFPLKHCTVTGTNLGNLGPAGAWFQVPGGACYAAVASFLLPGQGFQTVFFYLCGWKIKVRIRITVGQSHLREHVYSSAESR